MKKFIFLLSIFLLCFTLSTACSSENTASEEKETNDAESDDNKIEKNDVENTQIAFNFSLEEFVQTYNKVAQDFENDEEMKAPILKRINIEDSGEFKLAEVKDGTAYTRELINETDDSGGIFILKAWYDNDRNLNGFNLSTSGSDNMASDMALFYTFAVFQTLGIDIGHLNDLLESEQDMLDVDGGNYSVHLAKIPETAIIIKIESK